MVSRFASPNLSGVMGPSIQGGWVSQRRHLIVVTGVMTLQIVQPLLARDSVAHRML